MSGFSKGIGHLAALLILGVILGAGCAGPSSSPAPEAGKKSAPAARPEPERPRAAAREKSKEELLADNLVATARSAHLAGDQARARRDLEQALVLVPGHVEAAELKVAVLMASGDPQGLAEAQMALEAAQLRANAQGTRREVRRLLDEAKARLARGERESARAALDGALLKLRMAPLPGEQERALEKEARDLQARLPPPKRG